MKWMGSGRATETLSGTEAAGSVCSFCSVASVFHCGEEELVRERIPH